MDKVRHIPVSTEDEGVRLDRWLKRHYGTLTQGRLEKFIRTGQVRIDGARAKSGTRLLGGQIVRVPPLPRSPPRISTHRPPLSFEETRFMRSLVVSRDESCLVLNKPAGLAVQGGSGTQRHIDGLLDALTFDSKERPRLVHRLDRDTSGVLLLARSRRAATQMGQAFRGKAVRKIYWTLTVGVPRPARGTIRMALARQGGRGAERMYPASPGDAEAKEAITHYAVVAHAGRRLAWTAFMPVTGRTHQIRAHAAYALETPIAGDGKYGGRQACPGGEIAGQMHLHARSLEMPHPDGGMLRARCDLPPHMQASWQLLNLALEDGEDPFSELVL